jgi:hypothetical protein
MILWTGESETCQCGHHIADHETIGTKVWTVDTNSGDRIPNVKTGKFGQCAKCQQCKEFRPSRVAHQEA